MIQLARLTGWSLTFATLGALGMGVPLARADSPITSTGFSDAYQDVAIVQTAKARGIIDLEIAQYLTSSSLGIDVKAAIVNALSWKYEGKNNAKLFRYFLAVKYSQTLDQLTLAQLTPDETLLLGYLTVMDDYFHPEKALPIVENARSRNPRSYTVAMISALVRSQVAFSTNWCQVWRSVEAVTLDQTLQSDLKDQAKTIILNYMQLYAKDCKVSN